MRVLSLNICILLFTFSVTTRAQEDKDRIPYTPGHPLLSLGSESVVLFGQWYGSTEDPSFLSPKLVKELYPSFIPPEYDNQANDEGYPRITTETHPVPKTGQKNLLLAMGYKPNDQLFMVLKDKSNKVVNSQLDIFKADLTIDLGFTLVTVKAVTKKNTNGEYGFAWVANKNPFKMDEK